MFYIHKFCSQSCYWQYEKTHKYPHQFQKNHLVPKEWTENARKVWKGQKHTQEALEKIRLHSQGKNNPAWKGGITDKNQKIRQDFRRKEKWNLKVYQRDNYECQFCHTKSHENLNAHHINKFKDFPNLRNNVENGITLCEKCHNQTKGKENKFQLLCEWILETKKNIQIMNC
jgi:5-methylcytosine-specific restriction endonuclease McrA